MKCEQNPRKPDIWFNQNYCKQKAFVNFEWCGEEWLFKKWLFHTDKLLLFKNQVQKIGEPKTFISCHEFKSVAYMFKVKFLSKDGVNAVSYLMMIITLINMKNLWRPHFKVLVKSKKVRNRNIAKEILKSKNISLLDSKMLQD